MEFLHHKTTQMLNRYLDFGVQAQANDKGVNPAVARYFHLKQGTTWKRITATTKMEEEYQVWPLHAKQVGLVSERLLREVEVGEKDLRYLYDASMYNRMLAAKFVECPASKLSEDDWEMLRRLIHDTLQQMRWQKSLESFRLCKCHRYFEKQRGSNSDALWTLRASFIRYHWVKQCASSLSLNATPIRGMFRRDCRCDLEVHRPLHKLLQPTLHAE